MLVDRQLDFSLRHRCPSRKAPVIGSRTPTACISIGAPNASVENA